MDTIFTIEQCGLLSDRIDELEKKLPKMIRKAVRQELKKEQDQKQQEKYDSERRRLEAWS